MGSVQRMEKFWFYGLNFSDRWNECDRYDLRKWCRNFDFIDKHFMTHEMTSFAFIACICNRDECSFYRWNFSCLMKLMWRNFYGGWKECDLLDRWERCDWWKKLILSMIFLWLMILMTDGTYATEMKRAIRRSLLILSMRGRYDQWLFATVGKYLILSLRLYDMFYDIYEIGLKIWFLSWDLCYRWD